MFTFKKNKITVLVRFELALVSSLGGGPFPPSEVLGPFGGPNTQCFSFCFTYRFSVTLSYVKS